MERSFYALVVGVLFSLVSNGCGGVSTPSPGDGQGDGSGDRPSVGGYNIPDVNPTTDPPDPVGDPPLVTVTDQDCDYASGYQLYEYIGSEGPGPHLNIVGIYQSISGNNAPGAFTIELTAPGERILVLSSYEPNHWTINVGPNTVLQQVILDGYYHQTATAPVGVPVMEYTYEGTQNAMSSGAYVWPDDSDGDTTELLTALKSLTGLDPHSFHGCYDMGQITLSAAN